MVRRRSGGRRAARKQASASEAKPLGSIQTSLALPLPLSSLYSLLLAAGELSGNGTRVIAPDLLSLSNHRKARRRGRWRATTHVLARVTAAMQIYSLRPANSFIGGSLHDLNTSDSNPGEIEGISDVDRGPVNEDSLDDDDDESNSVVSNFLFTPLDFGVLLPGDLTALAPALGLCARLL